MHQELANFRNNNINDITRTLIEEKSKSIFLYAI